MIGFFGNKKTLLWIVYVFVAEAFFKKGWTDGFLMIQTRNC